MRRPHGTAAARAALVTPEGCYHMSLHAVHAMHALGKACTHGGQRKVLPASWGCVQTTTCCRLSWLSVRLTCACVLEGVERLDGVPA